MARQSKISDPGSGDAPSAKPLLERFREVRAATTALCSSLEIEDYCIQSMPDVSPTKWHLAHTSWFFETFILAADTAYSPFHPEFVVLFNSYYEAVGPKHYRPDRGLLSRPTVAEVMRYRAHVDERMEELVEGGRLTAEQLDGLELGLHHEQQHQELMLTDIKHVFSCNPLRPALLPDRPRPGSDNVPELGWLDLPGGLRSIGHRGGGFAFDNESPRHREFLEPFLLASRLVTCGEYMEFMADGGYRRSDLWLSRGWATVQDSGWEAPLYWERRDDTWWMLTLRGMRPVDPGEPVCHVSQFEADAYARWTGFRLPTEAEWETAARDAEIAGNFADSGHLHPVAGTSSNNGPIQLFGDVWEWTASAYGPYPGFRAPVGALGEYNGKFMSGQMVLRGGSCVTPHDHIRATYRNFFYPSDRWQFSGIRLARDE